MSKWRKDVKRKMCGGCGVKERVWVEESEGGGN